MKTKLGFLLSIGLASLTACQPAATANNSNIAADSNTNNASPVNTGSLEINREVLKREAEKVKKDLPESKTDSADPKLKSSEMHENLRDSRNTNNQNK